MLLSLAVLSATQDQDLLSSTFPEFSRSLKLDPDGKYTVYWANNETHIAFDVHVQTKGYVAFGISTNGKMFPADVVIGWVKDGTPYFYVSTIKSNCLLRPWTGGSQYPISL